MSRSVLLLFTSLKVALAGFGLLADRALVREAVGSAELSSARSEQEARAAALSASGGRPYGGRPRRELVDLSKSVVVPSPKPR
jgi:hypothetical protein